MAENTIQRVIEIDTTSSVQTVRDLQNQAQQLQDELKSLDSTTTQYSAAAQRAAKAQEELAAAFEIAKPDASDLLASVEQLTAAEARDAAQLDKVIDSLVQYRDAGYDVSASLGGVSEQTDQAARSTQELDTGVNALRESGAQLIDTLVREQQALSEVQAQRKALNKEIAKGLITEEQASEIKGELVAQESIYKARVSDSRQALASMTKEVAAADGSYNQMSQTLGRLRNEFRNLSAEQRNSPMGEELVGRIQSLDTELKNLDASIGNYQRNVGNYVGTWGEIAGALQKAGVPVEKMISVIGKLSTIIVGAIATLKSFKGVIQSTQTTGDAMRTDVAGWSAAFNVFKKAVAEVDFKNLLYRMSEAQEAGRQLAKVLDSVFERGNSISIRRAELTKENAVLLATLRDTTKTYEERQAAGKKYLENQKELANEEIGLNKEVRDAQLDNLFALTNKRKFASAEQETAAKEEFAANIRNYNLNNEAIKQIGDYQEALRQLAEAEIKYDMYGGPKLDAEDAQKTKDRILQPYRETAATAKKVLDATAAQAGVSVDALTDFVKQYNLTNDAQVDAYVKAEVAYQQSLGKFESETIRSGNIVNSVTKSMAVEAQKAADDRAKAAEDAVQASERVLRDTLKLEQEARAETEANEVKTARENYEQELADFDKIVEEKGISEEVAAAYRTALAEKTEGEIGRIRKKYRDKEAEELAKEWEEEQKRDEERDKIKLQALHNRMGDADRQANKESAEANRDIKDPQKLADELSAIQQRLYETKIALIDEMLKDETLDTDTIKTLSNERADLEIKNIQRVAAEDRRAAEEKRKRDRLTKEIAVQAASDSLHALSSIIGEETEAGKAAAVAAAIIDTYKAANGAYASLSSIPYVGPALGAAAAAAAVASGIANVKKILSTNTSGSNSLPSTSDMATPAVVNPPAVIEQVPLTRTLTSASEEERLNQMASPQRVYVVYDDIAQAGQNVQVQQTESTF